MSRKRKHPPSKARPACPQAPPPPPPVDVVDGIPDCAASRPMWRWLLMGVLIAGWLAFLVTCWLTGGLSSS